MGLFNFGKNKQEKNTCGCSCGYASKQQESDCCKEIKEDVFSVKVLGSGCKNCHTLLENTKQALKSMRLEVEAEYVTDMQKIMEYGVMSMPALVVNEKVVSMGKVLKAEDIEKLFHDLGL